MTSLSLEDLYLGGEATILINQILLLEGKVVIFLLELVYLKYVLVIFLTLELISLAFLLQDYNLTLHLKVFLGEFLEAEVLVLVLHLIVLDDPLEVRDFVSKALLDVPLLLQLDMKGLNGILAFQKQDIAGTGASTFLLAKQVVSHVETTSHSMTRDARTTDLSWSSSAVLMSGTI